MNTSREVLLEALEQAIRPLEGSIVEQFCKIYNCKEKEIDKPISLDRLLDMAYSIKQQLTLDEVVNGYIGGYVE